MAKDIKDLTKEELVKLAEDQKVQIAKIEEESKKRMDNLINLVNSEFSKMSDAFNSIKSTCNLSMEHITKIGK